MHLGLLTLLAAALLQADAVLITRSGERLRGSVSREGADYVVLTAAGPRRIPAAEAGVLFEEIRTPIARSDERFKEAKRIFEEAAKLDEAHPLRNPKIQQAIETAQGAVQVLQLLEPHYGGEHPALGRNIQLMMQFIRLCRGAATSDRAGAPAPAKPALVPLLDPQFAFDAPPGREPGRKSFDGELGPGLQELAEGLSDPDEARRAEALGALIHPPSPLHADALLKLLETEQSPALLRVLGEGLAWMDPAVVLKSLGWWRKETDPVRRGVALGLARAQGGRAAFDFIFDGFSEAPPATHPDRALFASAFRQYRAWAIQALKDLLTKNRNPKLQIEIIRQLGVIGDKAAGPMLLKTLDAYPKDSAASLLKLGKPALPTIVEGAKSNDHETKRICLHFCRRLTGVQGINLTHFEAWWKSNGRQVVEDERLHWEEQARKGFAVEPSAFAVYDLPMESIVP